MPSTCTVQIRGMSCGSCSSGIEKKMSSHAGVSKVSVNLLMERGELDFDSRVTSADELVASIAALGYDVVLVRQSASSSAAAPSTAWSCAMSIRGMSCGSCSSGIEKKMKTVEGVLAASVNLLLERGELTFDSSVTSAAQLVNLVSDLGYAATLVSAKALAPESGDSASKGTGNGDPNQIDTADLLISGMTCASCVAAIERHAATLPGVVSIAVNLLSQSGQVRYRAAATSARDICDAISAFGFATTVPAASASLSADAAAFMKRQVDAEASWKRRLIFSSVFTLPLFIISMLLPMSKSTSGMFFVYVVGAMPLSSLLMMLLCSPVQFGIGARFYRKAWQALRHGNANMSLLVAVGTTAAYAYGVIAVIMQAMSSRPEVIDTDGMAMGSSTGAGGGGEFFFETSGTLLTFIVLGQYLETIAKGRTSEALTKLMQLQPATASLIEVDEATNAIQSEREIPAALIKRRDLIKVIRGAKVPVDGVVEFGAASLDEAMLTGESIPVNKAPGDRVLGGTIVLDGTVHVRVSKAASESTLAGIVKLMEKAQTSKAPIQELADKISSHFVWIVVAIALLTWFVWLGCAYGNVLPAAWIGTANNRFLFSTLFAIAVLVIACPCGLGLATPTAVMVGTGVGARYGVLIKGGKALEAAAGLTSICFDKTGTLTTGRLSVFDVVVLDATSDTVATGDDALFFAGSAELNSEHPIGAAIVRTARERLAARGRDLEHPQDFKAVSGLGLRCRVRACDVFIGNSRWATQCGAAVSAATVARSTALQAKGATVLMLGVNGRVVALLALADTIRPEAAAVVAHLQRATSDVSPDTGAPGMGMKVFMITGDNRLAALAVARQVGIPDSHVVAEVLPAGKLDRVKTLQALNEKVALVGDGLNDAPALAQADVGIAIGAGTDIAMEAAAMVLMKSELTDLAIALDLSRATFSRIRTNFVWAFGYNIIGVPIAAGLFFPLVQLRLPPELASLAMALSSVSVVVWSLLLKLYEPPKICTTAAGASTVAGDTARSTYSAVPIVDSLVGIELNSLRQGVAGASAADESASASDLPVNILPTDAVAPSQCTCKNCACGLNGWNGPRVLGLVELPGGNNSSLSGCGRPSSECSCGPNCQCDKVALLPK